MDCVDGDGNDGASGVDLHRKELVWYTVNITEQWTIDDELVAFPPMIWSSGFSDLYNNSTTGGGRLQSRQVLLHAHVSMIVLHPHWLRLLCLARPAMAVSIWSFQVYETYAMLSVLHYYCDVGPTVWYWQCVPLIGTSCTILSDWLLQIVLRTILKLTSPSKHWTSYVRGKQNISLQTKAGIKNTTFSDTSSESLVYDTLNIPPTGADVVIDISVKIF